MSEVIEAEAEEVSADLAIREPHTLAVAPEVNAQDLVRRLDTIADAMKVAMKPDVDYGVIPGTGTKPTLLKPGAEKLGVLFQLDVQLENEKHFADDGHLTVISRATVYHAPSGTRLGSGEGLCSTREAKYAWRKAERVCPACGASAIIKGKAEFGGGWLCWRKRDGCGAKFQDGNDAIEGQNVDKVPNPELADSFNTVIKMASKRARIDAILAVTGASALFTQDQETVAESGQAGDKAGTTAAGRTQGHGAEETEGPGRVQESAGSPGSATASTPQLGKIRGLRDELIHAGAFDRTQFDALVSVDYGVESLDAISKADASTLIKRLEARKAQAA